MKPSGTYRTAEARWAGLGPYYAMFPAPFSDAVVEQYSAVGDAILDPFAGRGTSLFSAVRSGRSALGIEVNPVGWIYSKTKLSPAPREKVEKRISDIARLAKAYHLEADALPPFFHACYSNTVRRFLLAARNHLNWRRSGTDRTLMAFLLTHLHGKPTDVLSNQMRQAKAMSPQYAIAWWADRGMRPPDVDPSAFLLKKLDWRYAKGTPAGSDSLVVLGDSVTVLPRLKKRLKDRVTKRPALMLTSPPYFGVTNYHYDQWIRLWLLGGPPTDRRSLTPFKGKHRGRFENLDVYRNLLRRVFETSAELMKHDAVVYVRTDCKEPTLSLTHLTLERAFPRHRIRSKTRPMVGLAQTRLFGTRPEKTGEVDLVLLPKG